MACTWALLTAAPAEAEKRVALVIGNAAYVHAPALRNPASDARAIGLRLDVNPASPKETLARSERTTSTRLAGQVSHTSRSATLKAFALAR
jgi:hypothetical protein